MEKTTVNILVLQQMKKIELKKNEQYTKYYHQQNFGMTEYLCLKYCYENGFYWIEHGVKLYDVLTRVSCWCCANKNKKELDNMFYYLPEYYLRIIGLLKQIKKNNNKNSIVVKKAEEFFLKML